MRLRSLDSDAATQYLTHRIRRVGGSPAILDSTALPLLIQRAGGIPRLLNTIADNALFEAFLAKRVSATADDVSRAADELELGEGAGAAPAAPPGAPARREGGPRAAAPARRAPATQDLDSVFDQPTGPRRKPADLDEVIASPTPQPRVRPGGKAGKAATAFSGRGAPDKTMILSHGESLDLESDGGFDPSTVAMPVARPRQGRGDRRPLRRHRRRVAQRGSAAAISSATSSWSAAL